MSESQEAAEAVEEQEAPASDEPAAEAAEPAAEVEEPAVEADEPAAEAPEVAPDPAVVAAEVELAEEELAQEAIPVPVGPAAGRQARVFLCDRGHRTVAVWSEPASCHARPTRSGGECGRQLYPIGELPEQVQKALNPLKASKKASKS